VLKMYGGVDVKLHARNSSISEVNSHFHAPAAFSSRKHLPVPIGKGLCRLQNRSAGCSKEKEFISCRE
jgi:hypothetical protein